MIILPNACSMDMLIDDNVGKIIGYFMGYKEFNALFKCPLPVLFRSVVFHNRPIQLTLQCSVPSCCEDPDLQTPLQKPLGQWHGHF